MPTHPALITEAMARCNRQADARRENERTRVAEIRHEMSRPAHAPAFTPLVNTCDDQDPNTQRIHSAHGGSDEMPDASTPDIERGVRLLTRVCAILIAILVIVPLIATYCK